MSGDSGDSTEPAPDAVEQGRIVTWDLPGNKKAVRSAKKFFVPGSARNVPR